MNIPKHFVTSRTNVRALTANDAPLYWELIQKNRKRLERDFPITLKNTENETTTVKWIRQMIRSWSKHKSFSFGIFENQNNLIIGQFIVKTIDWKTLKAELAYFIDKDWAGQGIITEVVTGGINFCFEILILNKVFIRAAPENVGSQRIAEKCGFTKERLLKKDHRQLDGTLTDVFYFGLDASTY